PPTSLEVDRQVEGRYASGYRHLKVAVHGVAKPIRQTIVDGHALDQRVLHSGNHLAHLPAGLFEHFQIEWK
ncbi:MAG: hypothetical protein ACK2UQ_11285, partial [Anaerolineae bacterium]